MRRTDPQRLHSDHSESDSAQSPLPRSFGPSGAKDWAFEELRGCPICGSADASKVLRKTIRQLPLEFSLCGGCGVIYQNPRLTRESLASYFSSSTFIKDSDADTLEDLLGYADYFDWDRSYKQTARLRLARILRFRAPPGDLLEVGTATGSFLQAARSLGFRVRGLDLSAAFAAIARKSHLLEIDVDYIEEATLPSLHYDVVCNFGGIACWRDPIRALSNIYRSLKADGIFVLNHFDVDSLPGLVLGSHHSEYNHASLLIYSRKTMKRIINSTGFEIAYSQNERQYASLGRIAGYLKLNTLLKILRKLSLKDINIPIIVPSTVFLICRKKTA